MDFLLYTPSNARAHNDTVMAEEIASYISEHFAKKLHIEALAEQVGLSEYHFIRIFKKETGFTPYEYIVNTRLATAKYLLKTTRLTVKDICYAVGFSSESVFCGSFKRHFGMTPAQYRTSEQI